MSIIRFRLNQRLIGYLRREVAREGLDVTIECEKRFENMIGNGVIRLANANALTDEERIRLTETNIQRYIEHMTERAMDAKRFPRVEVDDFDETYKKLCPIWPFC